MLRNRARIGARLARAGGQGTYDLLKSSETKIAGQSSDTASPRRIEFWARKPFKAVARVQIPLGPPAKEQVSGSVTLLPRFGSDLGIPRERSARVSTTATADVSGRAATHCSCSSSGAGT